MLRILGATFAALLGLAFGSFLNVCLTRWPEGESIVHPRSHCRTCNRALAWWENIPVLSWLSLRGRCRTCGSGIHWRYPLVEAAVATLWGICGWKFIPVQIALAILSWLLVALAVLDAENLWLPDWLTLPGTAVGFILFMVQMKMNSGAVLDFYGARNLQQRMLVHLGFDRLLAILAAAAIILLIRLLYWLIRRKEGIGLGDAKLMAMLAAWLGFPGALLSFFIGVVLGALVSIPLILTKRTASTKLPLGTFLCIGGIVSALWGQPIIAAYLRWAGF